MREQLIQYVNLLFAGAQNCEDIKQEILQNTLDRYDDLIAEGKVPEAAYRLAITGIGDINEILGTKSQVSPAYHAAACHAEPKDSDTPTKKLLRAIAVGLYILCPVPLFVLSEIGMDTIGLCGLLAMVAVATALMILGSKKEPQKTIAEEYEELTPQQELRKSIKTIINTAGLVVYLLLSFITRQWHITWIVFPIAGAVWQLVKAILDLKEAAKHEN